MDENILPRKYFMREINVFFFHRDNNATTHLQSIVVESVNISQFIYNAQNILNRFINIYIYMRVT